MRTAQRQDRGEKISESRIKARPRSPHEAATKYHKSSREVSVAILGSCRDRVASDGGPREGALGDAGEFSSE